jgi:hypothetical protein
MITAEMIMVCGLSQFDRLALLIEPGNVLTSGTTCKQSATTPNGESLRLLWACG